MLGVFIAFFIITILSVFICIYKDRYIMLDTPFIIMGITFILMIFGLFGIMNVGSYLILFISIIVFILLIIKFIKEKDKKIFVKKIIKPSFIYWILLFIIILLINKNEIFYYWDEFTFWGPSYKNLILTNSYDFKNINVVNNYPRILSTLEYFFNIFNQKYEEFPAYIALNLFEISTFMPAISKIKLSKQNILLPILIFMLIFFFPTMFDNINYVTIYSDIILGLLFGFGIYYIDHYEDTKIIYYLKLILLLVFITFIKPYSVVLALLMVMYILFKDILSKKINIKDTTIFICTILISYLIWTLLVKYNSNLSSVGETINSSLRDNVVQYFKIIFCIDNTNKMIIYKKFIKRLFLFGNYFKSISIFGLYLIATDIYILFFVRKNTYKKELTTILLLFVGFILYNLMLLYCYLFIFNTIEGMNLASYERYISSYLCAYFFFLILKSIHTDNHFFILNKTFIITCIVIVCSNPLTLINDYKDAHYTKKEVVFGYSYFTNHIKKILGTEKAKIYILTNDTEKYSFNAIKYKLTENIIETNTKNYSIVTDKKKIVLSEIEKTNWDKMTIVSPEDFADSLFGNFDYLIVYYATNDFANDYKELFESEYDIMNAQIYKVDSINKKLIVLR